MSNTYKFIPTQLKHQTTAYHMMAAETDSAANTTAPAPKRARPLQAAVDRSFSGATNLVRLLPTCTVLAFEALSPSFSNRGHCHASNRYLTAALIVLCSVSCVALSFTDSVVGRDGALRFGVATFDGFLVFGGGGGSSKEEEDLRRLRIRWVDWVHAFFSALLFLTLAFTESDVARCLFPRAGPEGKQWLRNLPLGVGFVSSFVFIVFPTTRRGIGYSDATPQAEVD